MMTLTGRLFALKLRHSAASRDEALLSIRQLPSGKWSARIGGRLRGKTREFVTRTAAERAVHDHYNEAMLAWVKQHNRRHPERSDGL